MDPRRIKEVLSRLGGLAHLLKRGSTAHRVVTPLPPLPSAVSGNVLLEYAVGAYGVRLLDTGAEIIYAVAPRDVSHDLYSLLDERLEEVVLLMKKGNDLGDVLVEVLGIDREKVAEAIYALRSAVGYRKLQVLLDDPYILDISVVGPGPVWVRHSWVEQHFPSSDFVRTNIVLSGFEDVVELQQIIATRCGTYVSTSNPIVDAQLPPKDGGHRVHLVSHTVSTSRRPEIVIRKKMVSPPPVWRLVEDGVLPAAVAELFKAVVYSRGSMIIAGPPGSGKTTLLRSILHTFVPLGWKVAIIEDTGEIDPPPGSSWVRYTTFELGAVKVDLFDLAKAALRASATKLIVVGETRGEEAKVLVQAMLTGLGGLCLPGDQLVFARVDGKVDLYEIKDIIEALSTGKRVEVATRGVKGVARWVPVFRGIVKAGTKRFIRIEARGGVVHEVHEDHPVITYVNRRLVTKLAKELKPGDLLVALPHPPLLGGTSKRFVVITDYLDEAYRRRNLVAICGNNRLSVRDFEKLAKRHPRRALKYKLASKFKQGHAIPAVFELNRDFGYVLGFFLADGNIEYDGYGRPLRVVLATDNKHVGKVVEALRRLGLEEAVRVYPTSCSSRCKRVTVNSAIFARFLMGLLGNNITDYSRGVPLDLALRASEEFRIGIIEGYFDGDGVVHIAKDGEVVVKAVTVNKKLAESMVLLLKSVGITSSMHTGNYRGFAKDKNRTYYIVYIHGGESKRRMLEIMGVKYDKHTYSNVKTLYGRGKKGRESSIKRKLQLVKVRKVEVVEKDSLLYDIEVPKIHAYAISGGLVLTHNTTFHGSSPEEVITRFTGPPINLSPMQVAMFNIVAIMGYGERPRRQLKRVVELLYDPVRDSVEFNTVWGRERDGLGVDLGTVVSRLRRWNELKVKAETPIEAMVNDPG